MLAGLDGLGRFEYLGDMARHFHLAPNISDDAFWIDQEARAIHAQIFTSIHAFLDTSCIGLGHLAVFVRCQREGQVMFFLEFVMADDAIAADTDDGSAALAKAGIVVAKAAGLCCTAGCIISGVEIEDDLLSLELG